MGSVLVDPVRALGPILVAGDPTSARLYIYVREDHGPTLNHESGTGTSKRVDKKGVKG
jgi:hypothetical protein